VAARYHPARRWFARYGVVGHSPPGITYFRPAEERYGRLRPLTIADGEDLTAVCELREEAARHDLARGPRPRLRRADRRRARRPVRRPGGLAGDRSLLASLNWAPGRTGDHFAADVRAVTAAGATDIALYNLSLVPENALRDLAAAARAAAVRS
jgi:hypothetical protein